MANDVKFYETWDLKGIANAARILLLLVLFFTAYYTYPYFMDLYKYSRFDAQTEGKLTYIKEEMILRQTQLGNKNSVDHFNVEFTYKLNGETFNGKDVIQGRMINRTRLRKILNSADSAVVIKYRSDDPNKSILYLSDD